LSVECQRIPCRCQASRSRNAYRARFAGAGSSKRTGSRPDRTLASSCQAPPGRIHGVVLAGACRSRLHPA